jgi:hypothetical protein
MKTRSNKLTIQKDVGHSPCASSTHNFAIIAQTRVETTEYKVCVTTIGALACTRCGQVVVIQPVIDKVFPKALPEEKVGM